MEPAGDYANWPRDRLISRISLLERELERLGGPPVATGLGSLAVGPAKSTQLQARQTDAVGEKKGPKGPKKFDPSKYSTRFIALKLAYLGKNYNGFEHQAGVPKPTIEGELWKALVRSHLITPTGARDHVDWSPWEYSKCGRTDAGVSAFGQVINLRVRSNRPLEEQREPPPASAEAGLDEVREKEEIGEVEEMVVEQEPNGAGASHRSFDPIMDEIPYARNLNRLLPPDIRVLAWCPSPPEGFSARYSCRERQYRYFFTQPAYTPLPQITELASSSTSTSKSQVKDGWLDIAAMRQAAKLFEGLHDFRNFCKVDGSKQLTNFMRRVFAADIVEVPDVHSALPYLNGGGFQDPAQRQPQPQQGGGFYPKVYSFDVRGSAFLWHQIRHMVAILFAVGQGLEPPSIVSELLDVQKHRQRPGYVMADETPLVLWDCVFPDLAAEGNTVNADADGGRKTTGGAVELKDSLEWVWLGEDAAANLHASQSGLADQLWRQWRERKMDELLANRLLDSVVARVDLSKSRVPLPVTKKSRSQVVFDGGDEGKQSGPYVPVLQKRLLPPPDEVNDKWAQQKGFANAEELRKTKAAARAARQGNDGGEEVEVTEDG